MKLSNISKDDLVHLTQLVKALQIAKFDGLTAKDWMALEQTIVWGLGLARAAGEVHKAEKQASAPSPVLTQKKPRAKLSTPKTKK